MGEQDGEKASLVLSCSTMDKSKQVEMNPLPFLSMWAEQHRNDSLF